MMLGLPINLMDMVVFFYYKDQSVYLVMRNGITFQLELPQFFQGPLFEVRAYAELIVKDGKNYLYLSEVYTPCFSIDAKYNIKKIASLFNNLLGIKPSFGSETFSSFNEVSDGFVYNFDYMMVGQPVYFVKAIETCDILFSRAYSVPVAIEHILSIFKGKLGSSIYTDNLQFNISMSGYVPSSGIHEFKTYLLKDHLASIVYNRARPDKFVPSDIIRISVPTYLIKFKDKFLSVPKNFSYELVNPSLFKHDLAHLDVVCSRVLTYIKSIMREGKVTAKEVVRYFCRLAGPFYCLTVLNVLFRQKLDVFYEPKGLGYRTLFRLRDDKPDQMMLNFLDEHRNNYDA